MLFDFLVEVLEEKINGKSCFILVAARHSPRDINEGVKDRLALHRDDTSYGSTKAIIDQIQSDRKSGNTGIALYSNKIDVLFFDESNKTEVFYAALAKGVFWLMQMGVNRGRYTAYAKIKTMIELGDERPYVGFSSFAATPTNQESHSIIANNINEVVASSSLRNDTVKRIMDEVDSLNTLVECKTGTIEESKQTIKDFLCMGLYIIPIKTQDIKQTSDWFNENYADSLRLEQLTLVNEYGSLVDELKSSVVSIVEDLDVTGDINDLHVLVNFEDYAPIRENLGKLVYICSASEALWMDMVLKESNEVVA